MIICGATHEQRTCLLVSQVLFLVWVTCLYLLWVFEKREMCGGNKVGKAGGRKTWYVGPAFFRHVFL